jgi:hypothetical protein
MADVPATAIERYKKLKGRADDLRAAYQSLGRERAELQDQLGRLSAGLQVASNGRPYVVGSDGRMYEQFYHDRGNVRSRQWQAERKLVEDAGLTRLGADMGRVNAELSEIGQRQAELAEQVAVYSELASRCALELRRRGWREHSHHEPAFVPYSRPGPAAA